MNVWSLARNRIINPITEVESPTFWARGAAYELAEVVLAT
jgi:hypothetical protein